MTTPSAAPLPYRPEQIWQARRAFFDEGRLPDGLVDDPVLRSWQRCGRSGRPVDESVVFEPVGRSTLAELYDAHGAFLDLARPELDALAGAVTHDGYAALLTDAHGRTLAVAGALDRRTGPLRQAFRPGVDVSEAAIGTSAMSLAIAERDAVRVLGPEHYFADNQIFHCCAAPVFDARGRLRAIVDASRDLPGLAVDAMLRTQQCARRIERQLFEREPATLTLCFDVPGRGEAWLGFDGDGRCIAANRTAVQWAGWAAVPEEVPFDALFIERHGAVLAAARGRSMLDLRRHDGTPVQVRAERTRGAPYGATGGCVAETQTPPAARPAQTARRPATTPSRAAASTMMQAAPRAVPDGPSDPRYAAAFERARRAHEAGLPVLVTGETGSGKEVAARALHAAGRRASTPFVAINCGALAPALVSAELFGHVDGAYTGARRGGSIGRLEAANGGTVLLDEIGDMPLDVQVALLRVLDRGELTPVGSVHSVAVDLRFLCATHRDLPALVAEGRFREDLYYRLAGCTLAVPPLRERADFDAVLDRLIDALGMAPERLGAPLRDWLRAQRWPGNVRQLQHALRLAASVADDGAPLAREHFPETPGTGASPRPSARPSVPSATASLPAGNGWKALQAQAIEAALTACQGNVTAAARRLGIGRATLYRWLAEPQRRAAQPASTDG